MPPMEAPGSLPPQGTSHMCLECMEMVAHVTEEGLSGLSGGGLAWPLLGSTHDALRQLQGILDIGARFWGQQSLCRSLPPRPNGHPSGRHALSIHSEQNV